MIHPLSAWLTRRRSKLSGRAAWVGLGVGLISLALSAWAWRNEDFAALRGLLLLSLAVLLLTPLLVATLAAVFAALELRGEQFLLLITLPERYLVDGCLVASHYRTRYLRAFAFGLIPALVLGALGEYTQIMMVLYSFLLYTPPPTPPDVFLPGMALILLALVLWGLNLLAARLGTVIALRWREVALAAVIAPLAMALVGASPLIVLWMMVVLSHLMSWWSAFCPVGAYLLFWLGRYLLGGRMLRDARRWVRRPL